MQAGTVDQVRRMQRSTRSSGDRDQVALSERVLEQQVPIRYGTGRASIAGITLAGTGVSSTRAVVVLAIPSTSRMRSSTSARWALDVATTRQKRSPGPVVR